MSGKLNLIPFHNKFSFLTDNIALRGCGTLFIHDDILNKVFGGRPSGAIFFIDKDKKILGVKFLNALSEELQYSRKIYPLKNGISFTISSPLRFFKIKPTRTIFEVKQEGDLIVLDLNLINRKEGEKNELV